MHFKNLAKHVQPETFQIENCNHFCLCIEICSLYFILRFNNQIIGLTYLSSKPTIGGFF